MDGSPYIFPRFRSRPDRFAANEEPSLDDLLSDPVTTSLMTSDGVRHDRLVHLIAETRARLGG